MPKKRSAEEPVSAEIIAQLMASKALLADLLGEGPSGEGSGTPFEVPVCQGAAWPGKGMCTTEACPPAARECINMVKVASYENDESFHELPQAFMIRYSEPDGKDNFSDLGFKVTRGGTKSGQLYVEEEGTWVQVKEESPQCTQGREAILVVYFTAALRDAPNSDGAASRAAPAPAELGIAPDEGMHGGIKPDIAPSAKRRRADSQPQAAAQILAKFQGFRLGEFGEGGKFGGVRAMVVCVTPVYDEECRPRHCEHPLPQIAIKSFTRAAQDGDIPRMRRLLPLLPSIGSRRPADLTCDMDQGWTALALAGKFCRHDVAEYLLTEAKADPNQRLNKGSSPMHRAVYYGGQQSYKDAGDVGAVRMLELLVKHGADINLATNECAWTPLHNASARMNREGFEYLKNELKKQAEQNGVEFRLPTCKCKSPCCRGAGGQCSRGLGCAYALFPVDAEEGLDSFFAEPDLDA